MHLTKKILYSLTLLVALMTIAFSARSQSYMCTLIKNGQLTPPSGSGSPAIQFHTISFAGSGNDATGVNAFGGYYTSPYKLAFNPPNESITVNLYFSDVPYGYHYYVSAYVDGVLAYKTPMQFYYPSMGSNVPVILSPVPISGSASTVEIRLTNS